MKAMVHSPDFFDIVAGVLQGDTLVPEILKNLRLCTLYVNRSN